MRALVIQILVGVCALVGVAVLLTLIGDGDTDNVVAFSATMQWLPKVVGLLIAVPSVSVLLFALLGVGGRSGGFFSGRVKFATFAFLMGMSFLYWMGVVALVALVIFDGWLGARCQDKSGG